LAFRMPWGGPLEKDEMSDQQMLEEHQKTWKGFIRLITWSTVAVAVTLALMGIFLV
jgi:hypothetical protein